jgi:hypothetical protein
MFDERDHVFATDVLNASLTLMSILVVVITFLAVEYKDAKGYDTLAEPIHKAIIGAGVASFWAGVLALVALIQLRLRRGSTSPLALGFALLILFMTLVGIPYLVISLMA